MTQWLHWQQVLTSAFDSKTKCWNTQRKNTSLNKLMPPKQLQFMWVFLVKAPKERFLCLHDRSISLKSIYFWRSVLGCTRSVELSSSDCLLEFWLIPTLQLSQGFCVTNGKWSQRSFKWTNAQRSSQAVSRHKELTDLPLHTLQVCCCTAPGDLLWTKVTQSCWNIHCRQRIALHTFKRQENKNK